MHYQRFSNESSSSDSHQKFNSLHIQEHELQNKSILDIGCNEGYFCFKAAELGAKKVIGIDYNKKWIKLAEERNQYDNVSFVCENVSFLKIISSESFDIVFLFSALHYMSGPQDRIDEVPIVLREISRILTFGGILIFEGGIIDNNDANWVETKRPVGDTVYFPSAKKLQNIFHSHFGLFHYVGTSVAQSGDNVRRHVYKAYKTL
jgi:SAM-dependent methyltransferase